MSFAQEDKLKDGYRCHRFWCRHGCVRLLGARTILNHRCLRISACGKWTGYHFMIGFRYFKITCELSASVRISALYSVVQYIPTLFQVSKRQILNTKCIFNVLVRGNSWLYDSLRLVDAWICLLPRGSTLWARRTSHVSSLCSGLDPCKIIF